MSNLSEQELNAGISRKAIETLQRTPRRNGARRPPAPPPPAPELRRVGPPPRPHDFHRPDPPVTPAPPPAPGSLEEHLAAVKENQIETPQRIAVVDTWDRQLDIVNVDGFNFRIRDTRHERTVSVEQISLNRIELERLSNRIREILSLRSTQKVSA